MSPYRVIVNDESGNTFIFAAMVSTKNDRKRIYILNKMKPVLDESDKDTAYAMSTKRNSAILQAYSVYRDPFNRRYCLDEIREQGSTHNVGDDYRTLFDCQIAAMENFCGDSGLVISKVL